MKPIPIIVRLRSHLASYLVRAAFALNHDAAMSHCRRHIGVKTFLAIREYADRRSRWVLGFRTKRTEQDELDRAMKQVSGALRDTINAHGPITTKVIPSAAKRLVGLLLKS